VSGFGDERRVGALQQCLEEHLCCLPWAPLADQCLAHEDQGVHMPGIELQGVATNDFKKDKLVNSRLLHRDLIAVTYRL